MTTPVEDISCHEFVPLSSLPTPFLESRSALFTDHCLSFNLFSVLASLCSLSSLVSVLFLSVLPQLVIVESPLINRINVFSDALCHALVPLSCFTVFGSCRTVPSLACSVVTVSQTPASLVPFFEGKKKIPQKHKSRIRCCRSLYFTRPSMALFKVLEAASS